jgi:hypothetical protein
MADDNDDTEAPDNAPDNIISFEQARAALKGDEALDDDEIISRARAKITEWQASGTPTLDAVQDLFRESIRASASPMARDKIIEAIIAAYDTELGGKRAMISTWNQITKDYAAACAEAARENTTEQELTPAQKAARREALWPSVCELAQSPDLMNRVVKQIQTMGVVGELELITLIYIAATSRVLEQPINVVVKGASSGGKSYVISHVLELIGPDFVNKLTSGSALSLFYGTRSIAHTVIFLAEAGQLNTEKQGDRDSTYAYIVRELISSARIAHETSVEDSDSPSGRRVEKIVREGPIVFLTTTTTELFNENENRMLAWNIHDDRAQTQAIMAGLAARAAGASVIAPTPSDLAVWHDLQRWIALGPNDAVIPFARQITDAIPPLMVRFRRDAGSLLNFIKTSAILHQAQRETDEQGRVIATVADYACAFPIFCKAMSVSSGKDTPENVRTVVQLIADRAAEAATKPKESMRFKRVEVASRTPEIEISSELIGTATGLGRSSAYKAVVKAIELGFLTNNETRPRKAFRLVLQLSASCCSTVSTSRTPHYSQIQRRSS